MLTFYIIGCILAFGTVIAAERQDKRSVDEIGYRPSFFIIIDVVVYLFFIAISWISVGLFVWDYYKQNWKSQHDPEST